MKHIIVQEPVDYIEFDNGAKIKYDKLYHEIDDMRDTNWTEFDRKDPADDALFRLIEERLNKECTSKIGYIDDRCYNTRPRIYWNDNYQFIYDLLDEIMNIRYNEEKEEETDHE